MTQLFRLADLLLFPETVRSRSFREVVTDRNKLRRALNRKSGIPLGALGELRPAATMADFVEEKFWKIAIPDFRKPTSQWLYLLPFEVNLSARLAGLEWRAVDAVRKRIENFQLSGMLRVYPPGVGLVRLSLWVTFKASAPLDTLLAIARNLEEPLFGPEGGEGEPVEQLLRAIIDEAAAALFGEEGRVEDRRWRPPEALFVPIDQEGFDPAAHASELAELLAYAAGQTETTAELTARLAAATAAPHWQRDRVFAAASQRAAFAFVSKEFAGGSAARQRRMRLWLAETWEMAAAAVYTAKAFSEVLLEIAGARSLDQTWAPPSEKFDFLSRAAASFRAALQAVALARTQLQSLGSGVLMTFAKDLWTFDNPIPESELHEALTYLEEWGNGQAAADFSSDLREIAALSHGFRPKARRENEP
ncbi:MAG TPA: hypothetical protein DEH78_17665 [Solibacterales bacterium]|nr:hypothetical protein [Bryobacterales bacterium]